MHNLATRLPTRWPDLVSWRAGENGPYLIRNRASGDSFQIGEEEHFLLSQLDGRQTPAEICQAFSGRFGQELSEMEFGEFIELADTRALLQSGAATGLGNVDSTPLGPLDHAPSCSPTPRLWRRVASRILRLASTVLQWPARALSSAAARIDMLRLKHLEFVPRPDDIFIVTYPRSGTTWMQMILYQLTTDGNMDFPHIAEYCPWFEKSVRSARAFETRPSPRLFKSHLAYPKVPKGPCKYIYVARNGKDVAVSYYHLYRMYNGYEGTFAEFFDRFLRGKVEFGSWFKHVKGWWAQRDEPNVLFLTYEELNGDLEGCIRRIARFIDRDVSPERLDAILPRCSFAFMKEHEARFDPVMETLWEQSVQLKSFLRNGKVGDGAVSLSSDQQAHFDAIFEKRLAPLKVVLGSADRAGISGAQP